MLRRACDRSAVRRYLPVDLVVSAFVELEDGAVPLVEAEDDGEVPAEVAPEDVPEVPEVVPDVELEAVFWLDLAAASAFFSSAFACFLHALWSAPFMSSHFSLATS